MRLTNAAVPGRAAMAVHPITRLCTAWQEQPGDDPAGRRHCAEELLRLLGWDLAIPFTARECASALHAVPFVLRAPNRTVIIAYFLPPDSLEPPSAVVERYLDFCPASRMLVDEAKQFKAQYALITDLFRTYLYDTQAEELLLYADDPADFYREFAGVLPPDCVAANSLAELRRQPYTNKARQLRLWRQGWTKTLQREGKLSEEIAGMALDRLLALRFLFGCEVFRRTKWRLQQRFDEITDRVMQGPPDGCGAALVRLFHDMYFDWKIDLFEITPPLDAALQNDDIAMDLIGEFALLSSAKFDMASILESFNHGMPSDKLLVRTVPDFNEEREQYLSRQRVHTVDRAKLHIDISEEGYRAITYWFDRLVALYEELDAAFTANAFPEAAGDSADGDAGAPAHDGDLLSWSEVNARRPGALVDRFTHACEKGIAIYYDNPLQHRIARLLLTLHLIQRYAESGHAVETFPRIARCLNVRPLVVPKEDAEQGPRQRVKVGLIADLDNNPDAYY